MFLIPIIRKSSNLILKAIGLYSTTPEYDSWYESLKLRNQEDWQTQWKDDQIDDSFFLTISRIQSLPNPWLYPCDKLYLVLFNRFSDLSNVEAIMYIEDELGIEINVDEALKGMTLSDLIELSKK